MPFANLACDIDLVRQQAGAKPHQSAYGGALHAVGVRECRYPQGKITVFVEMTVEEPLLRRRQLYEGVEFKLSQDAMARTAEDAAQARAILRGHPGWTELQLHGQSRARQQLEVLCDHTVSGQRSFCAPLKLHLH